MRKPPDRTTVLEPVLPLDQVVVGDCAAAMARWPAGSVDLVFADPPYNLQLKGRSAPAQSFGG